MKLFVGDFGWKEGTIWHTELQELALWVSG